MEETGQKNNMCEITEEIAHINGIPKKLVVFLHGYIDCAQTVDKIISPKFGLLENYAIHIPQAPLVCEIHEKKRQWYSMHQFDPNDERKTVATLEECIQIYEKMKLGLESAYHYLRAYIDNLLNEYQLDLKDLYLCGFSQGAMLALYTSLMLEEKIGGCVSFSGIVVPEKWLLKHHKSSPEVLLLHGDKDNLVRFCSMAHSKKVLETMGCQVTNKTVKGEQHRITDSGLEDALKFISETTKKGED